MNDNKIVDVVSGNMEFGPRALCHTTTFAVPYKDNVDKINMMNNRNTVMPMAPAILRDNMENFFDKNDRIIGSDNYMIVTYDYINEDKHSYGGVMHKYPTSEIYSARPQVFENDSDEFAADILREVKSKMLINTSYNVHGNPIVFSVKDAVDDFNYQVNSANDKNIDPPYLVFGGSNG